MKRENVAELLRNLSKALDSSAVNGPQAAELLKRVSRLILRPDLDVQDLISAFSQSQVLSKNWLVETCLDLGLDLKTVFVCAGWYGTLFLDRRLRFSQAHSFDRDPRCEPVAEELHRLLLIDGWKFKAVTCDIHQINYTQHLYRAIGTGGIPCEVKVAPHTIVNTSCEHIENFSSWYLKIPSGKLLILQSNDGFGMEGHLNCSSSLDEFAKTTPLAQELYSGERPMPKFRRFMRIGYR